MKLQNRRAVITGGASGIGRAIARRFAEEGARVAVLDLDPDEAAASLTGLEADRHRAFGCNVADSTQVDKAFADVAEAFGGIDLLVNCAGTGQGPDDGSAQLYASIAQRQEQIARGETPTHHPDQTIHMTDEGWLHVIGINLNGAFWCSRAAIRAMAEKGHGGAIVNIASTSAASGEGPIHYVTSKAAIVGLTRGLAREVASRGIRVNAIHPGPTNTPIMQSIPDDAVRQLEAAVPLGRMAQPEEIAAAAMFLASDESSYATGSVVTVNGGSYMV
ncbi:SDR family NAD(P)-dependent oxidoreductase [Croceicoccus sp. F390]|uniref:SDR family NAD(P)-dependent oxidoreductase n=1 Tax=Croceicoccus esteveae TaxID=3075597 RepID=A0ABU2ZJU0_9SPHN|nr:SDR family NAD(P)-dependent oxidoreductase [Croceicoccus sp. F390]MDT0576868.1 SDR family NAD(P)-dependent oxidoreductase [Croceicoccus sp. F390]